MKNQALFSLKDKSQELKCRLLQFMFGALRVRLVFYPTEPLEWMEGWLVVYSPVNSNPVISS